MSIVPGQLSGYKGHAIDVSIVFKWTRNRRLTEIGPQKRDQREFYSQVDTTSKIRAIDP